MGKRIFNLVLVLLVMVFVFAGCGAVRADSTSAAVKNDSPAAADQESVKSSSDSTDVFGKAQVADANVTATSKGEAKAVEANGAGAETDDTGIRGTGAETQNSVNEILSQRKIIRNANISISVENYDKTYGKIQSLVEFSGIGYIQQSNVNNENGEYKSGVVVVRVQADKFSQILNNIKGLGKVLDANEATEDVTDKFYDVESELRLLKYEQSRLEDYLKKISDPDTIFKTEDKLTQIRHQIESLTGNLNKMNDLVKLSTITVNISEKPANSIKELSYLEKLSGGFSDSTKGVVNFFAGLLLFIVQALPVLIPVAVIVWIAYLIYRKKIKNAKKLADFIQTDKINNNDDNNNNNIQL